MRGRWRGPVLMPAAGALLAVSAILAGEKGPEGGSSPTPAWLATASLRPAIRKIEIDAAYVPAGGAAHGVVRLDLLPSPPSGARLRVVAVRDVDVPDGRRAAAGRRTEEIVNRAVTAATSEIRFDLPAGDMLTGTMQVQAEVLVGKDAAPVSAAWSAPVQVGVRKRVDLAGDWTVASMKVLEGDVPQRPKDWKPPAPPAAVALPGRFPFDDGFRGWVTLKREVSWKRDGDLQPRAVCVYGASDSARVRVAGADAGETAPVEDVAVLTHWVEFHCPFKGPENEQKRMLLIAGGTEFPVRLPLAKALPPEGKAEIEMAIRATSGGMLGQPKPPYGILNAIYLEAMPGVWIKSVAFDTEKPGEKRRFNFSLVMANETGKEFKGAIRSVYGAYRGRLPYTGPCPATDSSDQPVALPPGESAIRVVRDETPRFDTCRATFLLMKGDKVLDAAEQDYHTVAVEIRDRRDLYLNNERFIFKAHGSWAEDASSRLQLRAKGGNGFRGHRSAASWRVPGFSSEAANIDDRYKDGLLTSAGSALLASCEKCVFWNPKDTSNITKAVRSILRRLAPCPGIVEWEATNELHGETEEARVAILEAFHKFDPYHRPVMATKSSGEWEAEAREGRVAGVDIIGCQYLLSKEAVDSVTAAITEQPLMSTEVNWNDATLYNEKRMYEVWLDKGLCGSLLFDYSGWALDQPVPAVPPEDAERSGPGHLLKESMRALYQDMAATAAKQADGSVLVTLGNRMPYALRGITLAVRNFGQVRPRDLAPGDAATILLPPAQAPPVRERVVIRAEYVTHGGLNCLLLLSPRVTAAPASEGGRK